MNEKLPWFRMYGEAVDDEKLRLLAFEDRWHFVALLCCKTQGILDEGSAIMHRKVAVKLGVDMRTLEEIVRRLAEVELIDEKTLQPIAWDHRQFKSDTSKERTQRYRERMKRHGDVTVTVQETDTDTETDTDKETKTETNTHASPTGDVKTVFEFWKQTMKSPRALLDEKRRNLIRKALKTGYTVDQLTEAITGCAKSEWHMGKNDRGTKFNTLELILRNAEKIDSFIELCRAPASAKAPRVYTDISKMNYQEGVDEHGNF